MNFLLATFGTAGDVQPMLALGRVLVARGHRVRLCAPPSFRAQAETRGLVFFPFAGDIDRFMAHNAELMGHPLRGAPRALRMLSEIYADHFDVVDAASEDVNAIVASGLCLSGPSVAARRGIPCWQVAHMPTVLPSSDHPVYNSPWQNLPRWLNRLLWTVHFVGQNALTRKQTNAYRTAHGLRPVKNVWKALYENAVIAIDPELAAVPADVSSPYVQVGYWQDDEILPLPAEVERFLEAGEKPVYAGFGSMSDPDPARTLAVIGEATARAGKRVVVGRGWAGAAWTSDARVLVVDRIDHRALFPRLAAVLHHGGAGTTYTAARAGVPQLVVPHMVDQYFWGARVARLGLGPAPIDKGRLSVERLAGAIRSATTEAPFAEAATRMGETLRRNHGLTTFVERMEAELNGLRGSA